MVSDRIVSDNILKLRELTNKIDNSEFNEFYLDENILETFKQIKFILNGCSEIIANERSKDKKIKQYELAFSALKLLVNKKR